QSIASLIDITNLKQAEKEIKEQNEELVSINEEYLSQNEELKEAKEKAEESDRLKSAFLTNMSHEIRTPMNGILGFAELLKDPEIKSKERKLFLEVIEKSGIQLLSIINDIIDISKIETGQIEIRHNKICINDLLHELCAFFKPIVKDGVKSNCFTELPDDQSNIYTDKTKVTQILTNLINNAIKFTEKGHINIGYTLKSNYIEFYVEDTGIGIKPEAQELIFERFRQAETDNSTLYSGTGLGLSISKAYVEFLGGKIWLESKVNKGSTFYFVIPKDEAIQVDNDTHENMIIEEIKNEKIEKKTILVAEDNDVNYMYVCALLSEIDVEIVRAFDGKEAVDLVKSNPAIDLVLMDIKMPIMNGFEATREIKKFKKELPIIAVTAYALHEDRDRAIKEGCNDYLAKPFSKIQLIKLIRKYV
ncbi:MAG: response regulator, partial [Bacteroidales bacterium]|nr:response regulator [Bacteroidales bacterium]